jgi:hypothetical protein
MGHRWWTVKAYASRRWNVSVLFPEVEAKSPSPMTAAMFACGTGMFGNGQDELCWCMGSDLDSGSSLDARHSVSARIKI